jgi:hypothetical protein
MKRQAFEKTYLGFCTRDVASITMADLKHYSMVIGDKAN